MQDLISLQALLYIRHTKVIGLSARDSKRLPITARTIMQPAKGIFNQQYIMI